MSISSDDIVFFYSGGSTNSNPDLSLGGGKSSFDIPVGLNNLYDNISVDEANLGATDYRCFYVENVNSTDDFLNTSVEIGVQIAEGATAGFGTHIATDLQRITITADAAFTGGTYTVRFRSIYNPLDDTELEVPWDQMASSLETQMNAISELSGVSVAPVVPSYAGNVQYVIDVSFLGNDINRYQNILEIVDFSTLTGATLISSAITKLVDGGPMNYTAQAIASEDTAPIGISFGSISISTGDMHPNDFMPIWIERVTPFGTTPISGDGVGIKINGVVFP